MRKKRSRSAINGKKGRDNKSRKSHSEYALSDGNNSSVSKEAQQYADTSRWRSLQRVLLKALIFHAS